MQYGDFAQLYDRLMSDVDYDAWAKYLTDLISKYGGGNRIAECACGTGELTIRLKKAGFDITGFDISQEMLNIAAQKARDSGLMINFICMDMKKLTLHKPHDVIISACDGVNYLLSKAELHSFFSMAYTALKSGGLLLFDISSRYKLENILGCNTFAEDDGECAYIWKNMYDEKSKLIEMDLSFYKKSGELYKRFCEKHIQRAHSTEEIISELKHAGFTVAEPLEAFTSAAPTQNSERIQFTAIKP